MSTAVKRAPASALIDGVAAADPDAPAIEWGAQTWSYARLKAEARDAADRLHADGVARGEVVAVTGQRTPRLVAAILGVLQSGAVLLTLDPALPAARRRMMLREAGTRRVVCVDPGPDVELSDAGGPGRATSHPDEAAYVFFTSGTSGVPNAVLGRHEGLSHFLEWQGRSFNIGRGDRCAQLTGLSFDVVLRDMLLPLTFGAVLCLPERTIGPSQVAEWLAAQRITTLHAVPSLANAWLAEVGAPLAARLRHVFFAGEPLTGALVTRWRAAFTQPGEIVNLYGPTETTLAKCFHVVGSPPAAGVQPVGRPLPDTEVLVLTEELTQVSDGERGQLAIRTPYRTLGYLNAPELTARRFVRNPVGADDEDDLVYLTGDLGRVREDGLLEVLGRVDDQLKLQGVRVEPQEVAAVLQDHPEITWAHAAGRADRDGEKVLVAYVSGSTALTAEEAQRHAGERLPAAGVPSRVHVLASPPLTANGKVDRQALAALDDVPAASATVPLHETVAAIWAEVLNIPEVADGDDFFDLGGHSLLALRMLSRVRATLGADVPIRRLFENPTLASFVRSMEMER